MIKVGATTKVQAGGKTWTFPTVMPFGGEQFPTNMHTWSFEGYRFPKKGEWFVSGAIPRPYMAPNDLTTRYVIVKPRNSVRQVQVYEEVK